MALAWELDLPAFEKLVLLALADCANDEGLCWPSIATLCRKTNASERTVQRSLNALELRGQIERKQVVGKGCKYLVHPRHTDTPVTQSPPPQGREPPSHRHPTPATVAPKPSLNRKEPSEVKTKRACVMPEQWQPASFAPSSKCTVIIDGWPPGELETQIEHFTAHHRAKGSRFQDWQDAWKTWVLNSRKWNNGRANSNSRGSNANGADRRSTLARVLEDAIANLGEGP